MIVDKIKLKAGWKMDNSYAKLPATFYSKTNPTPVSSPELIVLNHPVAEMLGLGVSELQQEDGIAVLAGNRVPEGDFPIAQAYAGHQFGYFTMLGDGRAVLLGEQITPQGERFDIQLKGSGRTPYSRSGDGRAALGPMLREYIISEAMHALGIATTRSLAVVKTGEAVFRETVLPGAVLVRIAASHLRVGTFQYAAAGGDREELRALADYTINRHFPAIQGEKNRYLALLNEVIKRQAALIAKWQLVGFIHGVMNTDNMTLSGETIDYGPCAFMDTYDPETVFSSIDTHGRYAYGNQPSIAGWNLARFAETLLPLVHENQEKAVKMAQNALEGFFKQYNTRWLSGMRAKLGLLDEAEEDEALVKDLFSMMHKYHADFTNTFRAFTLGTPEATPLFGTPEFILWHDHWKARLAKQRVSSLVIHESMKHNNPAVIPRNHRVEAALEAAGNQDYTVMEQLLSVLSHPYEYSSAQVEYAKPPEPSACRYRTFCGT